MSEAAKKLSAIEYIIKSIINDVFGSSLTKYEIQLITILANLTLFEIQWQQNFHF